MDTANNAHLPHTTRPSKHRSYLSPPHKKKQKQVTKKNLQNERTYRDGIPKKQPNKVGMVPQYPYGLSSLYLLPFFQPQHTHTHTHTHAHTHTHTQTNPCHDTPTISTANRMCMAIAALHNATHITPSHYNISSNRQQYTLVG